MFRFIYILILCCILCLSDAKANAFSKIDILFKSLDTHYIEDVDYKNLVLNSCKIITDVDNTLKLYNSNTNAYLYKNNNFIAKFSFPTNKDSKSWKILLEDILKEAINNSDIVSENSIELENYIIKNIAEKLDKYSRIEKNDNKADEELLNFKIVDNILYIESCELFLGFADKIENIITNNSNIDGVILDLRKNKGGYFDEAVKTVDLFLEDAIITYSVTQQNKKHYYIAKKGDILSGKPIAVLTSENTASSAEVIVAALGEQGRATTVGTQTYGKGSMQFKTTIDDTTLFLTNGQFYSPSGKIIENIGIAPQICSGVSNSCNISDKNNPNKDVLLAINLIKNNLG